MLTFIWRDQVMTWPQGMMLFLVVEVIIWNTGSTNSHVYILLIFCPVKFEHFINYTYLGALLQQQYLFDRGVLSMHLIWIVLSSWTLLGRLLIILVFGMRNVFLCRREQQELVIPCWEEREGLWLDCRLTVETSIQFSS